jgi:DNA-directed RNA polymerase specialized sigma24 family protein
MGEPVGREEPYHGLADASLTGLRVPPEGRVAGGVGVAGGFLNPPGRVQAMLVAMNLAAEGATTGADLPALQAHAAMMRRYLFVLGARADRIDDLVQEVFVLVLQKPIEDRGPAAVGAFLRGVARNLLLRERRSAGARREVELAHEVWQQECGTGAGDERIDALRQCVDALPQRSRALLQRVYADGAGRAAAGAEFGLAADGVKTALRRLRDGLRGCVERRLRGGT